MPLKPLWKWLEATDVGLAVSQSTWLFPAIETTHVIALSLVVGSIAVLDLRLLDASWRARPVIEVAEEVLPWTWVSFVVAVIAGVLMFMSAASKYAADLSFRIKMVLIVLAGVNMIVFHLGTYRQAAGWSRHATTPLGAKLAGGLSLAIWIGVVACGRWTGFTTQ